MQQRRVELEHTDLADCGSGGDVKIVLFVPKDATLMSVIEYPDLTSAQQSVAGILALRTLEFVSIEEVWDIVEFTQLVRKAAAND